MANQQQNENQYDEIIVIFDPNEGSPYTRRRPIIRSEIEHQSHANWSPDLVSLNSEMEDVGASVDTHAHALPIEIDFFERMQNLRNRRQPHYNGVRSPKTRRVIYKSGRTNINFLHLPERSRRFILDCVTTVIEQQWRYVFTIFLVSYFTSWLIFAILWYLISYSHGDLTINEKGEMMNEGSVPCLTGAETLTGFLLLSFELQSTVGFGERFPNDECPEAIFLMAAQIVVAYAIEGAVIAIVYAKMVRPPRRPFDMKFSKKAVISQRDSKLCLQFRVCDPIDYHVIGSVVRAYMVEERISAEGEVLHQFQRQLKLENDGHIFVIFPLTICHFIDAESPLYDLSAKDLLEKRFEIVVTFIGGSRSTGQISEERTSYLSKEILWGHRFNNDIVGYDYESEVYVTNYEHFDETVEVDTPLCSAKRLDEMISEINKRFEYISRFKRRLRSGVPGPSSNDALKSPASADNSAENGTTALVKEVRFRLSQYKLDEINTCEESHI